MPKIVDWAGRMREVADFVGLGQAELDLVRATAPVVLKHADALTVLDVLPDEIEQEC